MKRQREKGQAILEFAVILPVFILVGFGLVDMQYCLERTANMDYIVNETARCMAMSNPACDTPKKYADELATGLRMDTKILKIESAACGLSVCTAVMSYPYKALGAYFPSITINRTGIAALLIPGAT